MKPTLILIVCTILVLSGAKAQTAKRMDFGDLLNYALHNNRDLKEAKFQETLAELSVKETKASGLPKLNASVDYKDYLTLPTMILPGALAGTDQDIIAQFGKKFNLDAGVQLSQLLFSLDYVNGLKTAKKVKEIRKLEVEKSEIELFQLIYTEYYNLIAIYKNLEIVQNNMESLNLTRENLEALVAGGLALQTELDRIEINVTNLEASAQKILTGIQVQTNNIQYIIGMAPATKLEIDTTGFMDLFNQSSLLEQYNADQFSPDKLIEVQLIHKSLELNKLQIKTAKASTSPTISFYGSYSYQAQREKFNFLDSGEKWFQVNLIGLKATIPIFNGFANRAKIASAKIEKEVTMIRLEKSSGGLNLQYQNSLMNFQANVKSCRIQQKNIELAKRVVEQESLKLKEGISTLTDYLTAVSEYRNTQIDYAQNFIDMKKSEIELLKNQGLLKVKMNTLINN
jgi:outer membrane protein TolC